MPERHLFLTIVVLAVCMASCDSTPTSQNGYTPTNATMKEPGDKSGIVVITDYSKGRGRFINVTLTHPLNQDMVAVGRTIYTLKCMACHKLTDEKMVGPGWKGITDIRKPEWIMNFETNTDEMLNTDPAAAAMLQKYIVRMPNPQLNDEDSRKILEFMRYNDGKN